MEKLVVVVNLVAAVVLAVLFVRERMGRLKAEKELAAEKELRIVLGNGLFIEGQLFSFAGKIKALREQERALGKSDPIALSTVLMNREIYEVKAVKLMVAAKAVGYHLAHEELEDYIKEA